MAEQVQNNNSQSTNNNDNSTQIDTQSKSGTEKMFTQADVNRMMAAEKESGRKSILKELGITDVATAKEGLQKYQEYLNSQKSELQKAQESQVQLQNNYDKALKEANHMKNCMAAMKLGANPDSVEELTILASSKVTEEKNFESVLSEMKNNSVYSGFFKSANVGTGTGGLKSNPAEGKQEPSLAESLAKKSVAYREQKSNFFKLS